MNSNASGVFAVVLLTVASVRTMLKLAGGAGRAFRRAGQQLDAVLVDAAAPELEEAPRPDRPGRAHRFSPIEIDVYDIHHTEQAARCQLGRCIACEIVTKTPRRLP